MERNNGVKLEKMIEAMRLKNITPTVDISKKVVTLTEINRPALQLTGFYANYTPERVQIIGNVENDYLMSLSTEERIASFERLCSTNVPCIIYAAGNEPEEALINVASKYGVPLLGIGSTTSELTADLIRWLRVELAPMISIHGVLVDVFGEGVLITGESGIGKSEAALELIRRGHRLVSDDVVELKKVDDVTLIGTSPSITRHFIELRGIGIIDVKALYGIEGIEEYHQVGIVVDLVEWQKDKEYDRLGLEDEYTEYMDIKVPKLTIPIRPGRNLAIILETAALNHRQRNMGYNAAKELYRRVQENLTNRRREN